MDWLDKNHGMIVCKDRRVYTQSGKKKMLLFMGLQAEDSTCIIFYARATKNLNKECQGFVASVVLDDGTRSIELAHEKVFLEFPNVFLKALYRMALMELSELKKQLKQLLDKN